ncbi:MAG: DNA internalization-related competence protein ComEC/Rec2 [Methylophilaceae bacterium]
MIAALLALVLGCWLLQLQAALPNLWWGLSLLILVAVIFTFRRHQVLLRFCIPIFALAAGFFWATFIAQTRLNDALSPELESQNIEVIGVVANLPQHQERGLRFVFDVEQTLTPQAKVPQKISLTAYQFAHGQTPNFHAGERWQLTVRLKRPHGTYNPHGFDFEEWALERNIRATGYVRESASNQRLQTLVPHPAYWIEHLRENIRNRMQAALQNQPYEPILRALAIGDDSNIPRADWEVFLRTGITHLISISGLHITMVSGLFFGLTYALWRRSRLSLTLPARKAATIVGVLIALSYALLAGFSVPTQRTVYMLAVVALALWSGKNISITLTLAWALGVTVLLDPWAVLAPGFWLSFGAVAVICYASVGRVSRPHWLHEAATTQWAVTLGSIPLLLGLFQQTSIISPLANAFAIPLVSLVITPLTLLGAVLPFDFILELAHRLMAGCMWLLQFLSTAPSAVWQQHAPAWWTVILATLGTLWMLLPRGFPARWLGIFLCLPMFFLSPQKPQNGAMRVTVMDVGQGLSVLIETASHALLYDTGTQFSSEADSGNRVIVPFLRALDISRLDGMIVSHNDNDHSGGAISIIKAVPTRWLASSLPINSPILAAAQNPIPCFAGQTWVWDKVRFDMLHPTSESYKNSNVQDNNRGCVLKITSQYGSLLLPADIEKVTEGELLTQDLKSDVLVVPHHGSKTSSTPEFIAQVKPVIAIFTVGYRNRFGHPKTEIVERYQRLGSRIYRSDRDGAVLLNFGEKGIAVQEWRGAEPRYWN